MADLELFAPCKVHENCTFKTEWVAPGTVGFDQTTDQKAVTFFIQQRAEEAFGEVYCVATSHIDGVLEIRREE